jgi:peptide deformylase
MKLKISDKILEVNNKEEEEFLRKKTIPFDFSQFSQEEIKEVITKMRKMMKEVDGIGLSANQVGLPYRFFIAEVPDENGYSKFYTIFNPKIIKKSEEIEEMEEGCLSVPLHFGNTPRAYKLVLEGQDSKGKKIKIKAWGLLARVFQHEVDHLDGILFIDKAKDLYKIEIDSEEKKNKI